MTSDRIAKEDFVTAAIATAAGSYQPVDSDLTAIAALTTTSYGRAFLALADAAAGRTALALGTAATHATGDYDAAGAAAAAQAASQPLDSDLTAIAALSTTSYGRGLLALASAAANMAALSGQAGADFSLNSHKLTAVSDGSAVDDAATFGQVTNLINGRPVKLECRAATTAALPTVVYSNGSSGVGATLTGFAVGALGAMDGTTLAVNDRLLVKNQVAGEQDGAYNVTATGSGIAVFVLTRATDSDQAADLQNGASYYIVLGTTLADTTWALSNDPQTAITIGTTALAFAQVDGAGSTAAGNGLSRSGNTLSIDTAITVDKTTVQTLTNKTLTSPAITTPTGIVKGDVGLGNVDNTSDATKNAASVTLTNKTLTSPVLNTGVSGTAIDTDATMAANSDTILATQKATKTALALKANLASPVLTGTPAIAAATGTSLTTTGDLTTSAGKLVVGAPSYTGSAAKLSGTVSAETAADFGLIYVGTGFGVAPSLDLRRVNGTFAVPLKVASGDVIFGLQVGACTTDTTTPPVLDDVAQIWCVATQDYSSANNGNEWEIWTTPNNSSTKMLAVTIGQDQSLTVVGATNLAALNAVGVVHFGTTAQVVIGTAGNLTTSANITTTGTGKLTVAGDCGFHGTAAVGQSTTAAAAPAGGTGATAGAYDTAANRNTMITLVNAMRTCLRDHGLMA